MIQETATISMQTLSLYKEELKKEWMAVLDYWMKYTVDEEYGGFYGSVNNNNIPDRTASKGIVMNSRILWAFSASYIKLQNSVYLDIAHKAFNYILGHFIDHEFGGVYWSVDSKGKMRDGRKQIYGLAFCIYGMCEYYKATGNKDALDLAKELFHCIEKYSYDKEHGGYLEAFTREWGLLTDVRLSDKDDNEKKTMNTHLHVIEAYANLYQVWPGEKVKERIIGLLDDFDKYMINKNSFHLNLFMDEKWNSRSSLISFGHDIEAAWLLPVCAETVNQVKYIEHYKELSIKMTTAAIEGLDKDGGLLYEYEPGAEAWVKQKHSWPQAEAMVGFMNAYQLTGDENYLQYSLRSWAFIKKFIIDKKNGEWFWGIDENNNVMNEDKAGSWKCPYHNTRGCMEVIKRIDQILK